MLNCYLHFYQNDTDERRIRLVFIVPRKEEKLKEGIRSKAYQLCEEANKKLKEKKNTRASAVYCNLKSVLMFHIACYDLHKCTTCKSKNHQTSPKGPPNEESLSIGKGYRWCNLSNNHAGIPT